MRADVRDSGFANAVPECGHGVRIGARPNAHHVSVCKFRFVISRATDMPAVTHFVSVVALPGVPAKVPRVYTSTVAARVGYFILRRRLRPMRLLADVDVGC